MLSCAVDRGQGLNHAICDAAQLVKAISASSPKATINGSTKEPTSDAPHLVDGKATAQDSAQEGGLEAAITAYDAEVVRRGAEEVDASCRQAAAMLDWGTFMESPMMKFSLGKIEKV